MSIPMRVAKFPPLPAVGIDVHKIAPGSIVPPAPVPPVPAACWVATICNYPSLTVFGKFTRRTRTDGLFDTICGNDWGAGQPHIPVPTILASNIIQVLIKSSHKHFIPAYAVIETAEGGALAALSKQSNPIAVCSPVCLIALQDCSEPIALPVGLQFHAITSRWVGMTVFDLLAGACSMAGDICTDALNEKLFGKFLPDSISGAVMGAMLSAATNLATDGLKAVAPDASQSTGNAVAVGLLALAGPAGMSFAFGQAADMLGEQGRSAPQ